MRRAGKLSMLCLLVLAVAVGITLGVLMAIGHDLPPVRSLETFQPSAVTRIYSSDDVLLSELFAQKRDLIAIDTVPQVLVNALLATEDRHFFEHSGVDLKGILRAVIHNIWAGEYVEGASTITQQLTKTLFLTPRKTLTRKLKEAILAFQLERRYTKMEILEMYLNQVYFGSGAYGVESAARRFFGKSVTDLNLAESALIAGMPKAPSRYTPLANMELALKRRNRVLDQMRDIGFIGQAAYLEAVSQGFSPPDAAPSETKAPYFAAYVVAELEKHLGPTRIYKGGLSVSTTLSIKLQQSAEQAVDRGLAALDQRIEARGDSGPKAQCALVALDVQSGGILAMIGGRNFVKSPFNRAVDARRQPGSAFKPIVYSLAVEKGFAQNRLLLDAPVIYKGADGGRDYRPQNFSGRYRGEMTLRMALARSQNIPAVKLIEMIGPSSVAQFAQTLGIESAMQPNLSLALGSSELTLMELTAAYAVFANQGRRISPLGVSQVVDQKGRSLWVAKPHQSAVVKRSDAAITVDLLQAVVQEGTGRRARGLKRGVAGKTGTTNGYRDALFVGFSATIAAGVWVGRDDNSTLGEGETGSRAALPIWVDFMQSALDQAPVSYFDIPDGVTRVSIDPLTGKKVPQDAPNAVRVLFKTGSQP